MSRNKKRTKRTARAETKPASGRALPAGAPQRTKPVLRTPDIGWWHYAEPAAPWLLIVAALGLRLYHLDREPLWFDEAYTALSVTLPVGDILTRLRGEGNAPLYYVLMHVWIRFFGDSEFALRSLSALFGAAAIPLLYWVGARMFSRRAGLIAAALAVVSPLHVHYSQEVRMYPLVPPLALVALYTFYRLLIAPSTTAFVGFVLATTAGLYVHYYFLFVLPLFGLAIFAPDRRRALLLTGAALLLVAIGFAPWIPSFIDQAANPSPDWIGAFWKKRSISYAVLWSLEILGPGGRYPTWATFKFASSDASRVISLGLAFCILVGAVGQLSRDRRDRRAAATALTLAALLVPLLIAFVVSLLRRPVYAVARYDLIAWSAYYLLAGAVLSRLKPTLSVALVTVWLALSCYTLVPYVTTDRPKKNYADLGDTFAELLAQRAQPEETVIFTAATRTMTQYYLRNVPDQPRLVSYPLGTDDHLGWIDGRIRTDRAFADQEADRFVTWLVDSGPLPPAIWVVAPGSRGTGQLLSGLQELGYRRDPARSMPTLLRLQRVG